MSPELIVSLTSYPARIGKVHIAIDSLLKQTLKPDRIVLYLADDQFPGREADLPTELLKCVERGLTISWCEDFKSHKKLIPALIEYPDAIIVTFDDDIYFEPTRLELLYNDYIENHDKGNYIYCHRITRFFKGGVDGIRYLRAGLYILNPHIYTSYVVEQGHCIHRTVCMLM